MALRPHLRRAGRRRHRLARARPDAAGRPLPRPRGHDAVRRSRARPDRIRRREHRRLRPAAVRRSAHVPALRRLGRCGDEDLARGARRRSHLEHAEADPALPRGRRRSAEVRARAADSGPRQEAAEQAPRRDVGHRVREAGLPAGGDVQFPLAARLVAGQRSRSCSRAPRSSTRLRSKGSAAATPCSTPRSSIGSTSSTSCGCRRPISRSA